MCSLRVGVELHCTNRLLFSVHGLFGDLASPLLSAVGVICLKITTEKYGKVQEDDSLSGKLIFLI